MSERDVENLITSLGGCFIVLFIMVAISILAGNTGVILRSSRIFRNLFNRADPERQWAEHRLKENDEALRAGVHHQLTIRPMTCLWILFIGSVVLGAFFIYAMKYSPQFIP